MRNAYPTHPHRLSGFTLIEILVALVMFAIGSLGVALYTSSAIRSGADNQIRSTAFHVASQTIEPLYAAAGNGAAAFQTALLTTFPAAATYQRTVYCNAGTSGTGCGNNTFTVRVLSATDDTTPVPVNWLTGAASAGVTVTIVVRISYTKSDSVVQNDTTTFIFPISKA